MSGDIDMYRHRRRSLGEGKEVAAMSRHEARRIAMTVPIAVVLLAVIALIAPIAPAGATLSVVSPLSGGTLEPGDSTQFTVTSDQFCVRASPSDLTVVVVVDLKGACGQVGERSVTVSVITTDLTPPGEHVVTVAEIGVAGVDGDEYSWVFTVGDDEPDATTTTTVGPTTTTVASTTTTSGVTSTTPASPTTTVAPADTSEPTPPSTPVTTVPAATPPTSVAEVPSTTTPADPDQTTTTVATPDTTSTDDDDDRTIVATGGTTRPPPAPDPADGLSGLAIGDFAAPFGQAERSELDGIDPWEFIGVFREGEAPMTAAGGLPAAPLLGWATRVLLTLYAAGLLTQTGRTPMEGKRPPSVHQSSGTT